MIRLFAGTALAVALLGSAAAYAAEAPASSTPAPASTTDTMTPPAATPPASLHCKAPKVATEVKGKNGKTTWKCKAPPKAPAGQ